MKSQLMTQAELAILQASGKTLEQDERGIKVTLLPDGNMLKVFRLRGWFSSSLIYSNARSFCRNAQRLHERNIPTVNIIQLIHLKGSTNTAVLYQPLTGETLNSLVKDNKLTVPQCEALGVFIAKLHRLGIHFKSLHFGNIVLSPQGDFGLIDIADMRIFPWALHTSTRLRGFKRLLRYQQDIKLLGADNLALMINAYVNTINISAQQQLKDKINLIIQQVNVGN
jgi:Lipopolysaccharide kinase (Kdo/WaaP) family